MLKLQVIFNFILKAKSHLYIVLIKHIQILQQIVIWLLYYTQILAHLNFVHLIKKF